MPSAVAELFFLCSWDAVCTEEKADFALFPTPASSACCQPVRDRPRHNWAPTAASRDRRSRGCAAKGQQQGLHSPPGHCWGLLRRLWEQQAAAAGQHGALGAAHAGAQPVPMAGWWARSRGQQGGPRATALACELPPALLRITQVLRSISEKLTSSKRTL